LAEEDDDWQEFPQGRRAKNYNNFSPLTNTVALARCVDRSNLPSAVSTASGQIIPSR